MTKKHTAQCACGAVKFEFNTDPDFIAVCHCLDCKKASGGEAATFFGVFLGAQGPFHNEMSNPGNPASSNVGISGAETSWVLAVTP